MKSAIEAAHDELFSLLEKDTTVLTPNRRLAATLHKHYHQFNTDRGLSHWETPDIIPLSSWILRLWQEQALLDFTTPPYLLNPTQEQYLWEEIVTHSKASEQLLQIAETAEIAKSAWGLLQQWQIKLSDPIFQIAQDYQTFHQWANVFEDYCKTNHCIDMHALTNLLIETAQSTAITFPKTILVIGFTELSPQTKMLLRICESRGTRVQIMDGFLGDIPNEKLHCYRLSLADTEEEIMTMARWAKNCWQNNENAIIGCVIPSLESVRDRVLQLFAEVFSLDNTYGVNLDALPFNISAGVALAKYPIIHTAFQLLFMQSDHILIETFNYLLASPFIGEAESERIKRCQYDRLLRQENVTAVSLSAILQTKEQHHLALNAYCPQLAARLQQFITTLHSLPEFATCQQWAQHFMSLLTILGWPGERSLNSEEYQIVDTWLQLLADYTSLDQIAKPINYKQALKYLQKAANKAIFQPKSPEARIQILGVLEAAALPFDYLWVSGMDDIAWPPQPKPNSLIPRRLQRELSMPHATAERELTFCSHLTYQFTQCAKTVIFSYSEQSGDLELQPSPLIREFKEITINDLSLPSYQTTCEKIYAERSIESLVDETAPPILPNEKVHGGINVLKQQAQCPFRAFAEWRLHAHPLETPLPGLRGKDRGNIIHKCLEMIWDKLKTQQALLVLPTDELNSLMLECIDNALAAYPHTRSHFTQYLALEKMRLHKLMKEWIDIEKQRAAFRVVSNEKALSIALGNLRLSVRIDRIDELEDGSKLIIDYKTGKYNEPNHWFGERPEEPQLPLYTLFEEGEPTALAFAQLVPGDTCFKGIAKDETETKGIKAFTDQKAVTAKTWDEQLQQWDVTFKKLSHDFSQGIAERDPKNVGQTCVWCSLKPLCRIDEELEEHDHHSS